jgi:lipopolysaccharide export system protein LptA
MSQIPKRVYVLAFLFLSCFSSLLFGLESDKNQKVFIVADSGVYNYKTGIDIYEGHVVVDQGTSHITADRLITKRNQQDHQIREAIAYGFTTLAHYWTLPNEKDPELHAKAKIIKFYPIESKVTLEKNVFVTQGENSFKGELIHYNRDNQTITVPATANARAVIVYTPEKK